MKTLLITGANGFLGYHMQQVFKQYADSYDILTPRSLELNLTDHSSVMAYFERERPDVILHMAAVCGGIGLNKKRPADLTHVNLKMAVNLFDAILKYGPEAVYTLGSVCSYPELCPVPFNEDDIWKGYPEPTNAGYGFAKKSLLMLQQEYRKQYGLKGAHLVPVNMYGPGDHFDLEDSHVIPALINKFDSAVRSGRATVECWGTGDATREFLYAGDAAEAILKAVTMQLDVVGPINLGTGRDISIRDLAYLIAELTHFTGDIVFTGEVSDGQPKRRLDVTRAKEILGWEASTNLSAGLMKTIIWYQDRKNNGSKE
jgi:GDP-L-fucose synthase